jgi:UDPglucose 6-dehydrogenase
VALVRVFGLGYVGLTTCVGLAGFGHKIEGIDSSSERVEQLQTTRVPFHEIGLIGLVEKYSLSGALSFHYALEVPTSKPDFFFICVPTPSSGEEGGSDLSFLESALASIKKQARPGAVVVIKSTVPIGTSVVVKDELEKLNIGLANNPEFLREGSALADFQNPDRIIVGAENTEISQAVLSLYSEIECPKIIVSLNEAETIKYSANAFLATKLSFVNEVALLCDASGSSTSKVLSGLALDPRIGAQFLNPGPGWGGSCFPKDTKETIHRAESLGVEMLTLKGAIESNRKMQDLFVTKSRNVLGGKLLNKKITVWGLAFKAGTDDIRDSPSLKIVNKLIGEGATVKAYDPAVKSLQIEGLEISASPEEACRQSELLLVLTEWPAFSEMLPAEVAKAMTRSNVIDTRGVLDPQLWAQQVESFWSIRG